MIIGGKVLGIGLLWVKKKCGINKLTIKFFLITLPTVCITYGR